MAAGTIIVRGSEFGFSDHVREFDSNATLTAGDLVNVQAGQLELADGDTSEVIAGVVLESTTNAGTGVPVNITPGLRVVMDNNNVINTFAADDIGTRYNVTGATGAQIVNTQSQDTSYTAPSHQLLTLEYNPQGVRSDLDSDTSIGLFMIAKHQFAATR